MRLSHYLSFSALLLLTNAAPMEEMKEHKSHSYHSVSHSSKSGTHTKSAHSPPPSHSGAMKSHHSSPPKKTRMSASPTATASSSSDPSPSPTPPTLADVQALIPDLPVTLPLAGLKVRNRAYGRNGNGNGNSQSQGGKNKGNGWKKGKGNGGKGMKGNGTEYGGEHGHYHHEKNSTEIRVAQGSNDDGRV